MQHTETLNLNLIETSDPFSPAPLNENTLALEAALGALRADLDSTGISLADRVTALEGRKISVGTYHGTGSTVSIRVGFTPKVVLVTYPRMGTCALAVTGSTIGFVTITSGGFDVRNGSGSLQFSGTSDTYHYFAIC